MMIFENHWESAESHWPPLGVPGHFGGFLHAGAPPIWHFELRTLRSQGQDLRMSFCSTPAQEKCSMCLDGLEHPPRFVQIVLPMVFLLCGGPMSAACRRPPNPRGSSGAVGPGGCRSSPIGLLWAFRGTLEASFMQEHHQSGILSF
jgi:hypothetical protein